MPYNEDAQPNEVRHTRKGNTQIPAIRSSHSVAAARPRHSRHDPLKGTSFAQGRGRDAHASSSNAIAISHSRWGAPSNVEASRSREGSRTQAPSRSANHKRGAWGRNRNQNWINAERDSVETTVSSRPTVKHEAVDAPSGMALEPLQVDSLEKVFIKRDHPPQPASLEKDVTQSPSPIAELDYSKSPTSPGSRWLDTLRGETAHNSALSTQSASELVGPHHGLPKDSGLDGVCWGRWEALSNAPRFRNGTFMLSLPRQSMTVGENPTCPAPSPVSRDVDVYSRIASPTFGEQILPASTSASFEAASHAPLVAASASEEVEDTSMDELEEPLQRVHLRKDPHDKPRRLLVLQDLGILSISMRGCIDLVEEKHGSHSAFQVHANAPAEAIRQFVDDACIVDGTHPVVVLGHARSTQQLSLVQIQGKRGRDLGTFDRPAQTDKNGGISAVCALRQPDMFVTGGYDHLVHLWSISAGRPPTPSEPLAIKHSSMIQSLLAIRDTSRKLITASADCSVNMFDLASQRVVHTLKLSNSVYHVHPTQSPFCILLEVAHRELQFEMRDYRLVPTTPVVRFGYHTAKVHGRYLRGALSGTTFGSGGGEKDGYVRLWDLRKPSEVMHTIPCLPGRKVIQVAFANEQMVACSEDHYMAFMNRIGDLT